MKIPKELIGKITISDEQKESNSQKFWRQVQMKHGLKFIYLSGKNGLE